MAYCEGHGHSAKIGEMIRDGVRILSVSIISKSLSYLKRVTFSGVAKPFRARGCKAKHFTDLNG